MVFLSLVGLQLSRLPSLELVSNTTKLLAPDEVWLEEAIDLLGDADCFLED